MVQKSNFLKVVALACLLPQSQELFCAAAERNDERIQDGVDNILGKFYSAVNDAFRARNVAIESLKQSNSQFNRAYEEAKRIITKLHNEQIGEISKADFIGILCALYNNSHSPTEQINITRLLQEGYQYEKIMDMLDLFKQSCGVFSQAYTRDIEMIEAQIREDLSRLNNIFETGLSKHLIKINEQFGESFMPKLVANFYPAYDFKYIQKRLADRAIGNAPREILVGTNHSAKGWTINYNLQNAHPKQIAYGKTHRALSLARRVKGAQTNMR